MPRILMTSCTLAKSYYLDGDARQWNYVGVSSCAGRLFYFFESQPSGEQRGFRVVAGEVAPTVREVGAPGAAAAEDEPAPGEAPETQALADLDEVVEWVEGLKGLYGAAGPAYAESVAVAGQVIAELRGVRGTFENVVAICDDLRCKLADAEATMTSLESEHSADRQEASVFGKK